VIGRCQLAGSHRNDENLPMGGPTAFILNFAPFLSVPLCVRVWGLALFRAAESRVARLVSWLQRRPRVWSLRDCLLYEALFSFTPLYSSDVFLRFQFSSLGPKFWPPPLHKSSRAILFSSACRQVFHHALKVVRVLLLKRTILFLVQPRGAVFPRVDP